MMRRATSVKIRPTAMLLVLLAHVPLVLLFLWGWRISRDEPESTLVFLSLWPQVQDVEKAKQQPVQQQPAPFRPAAPPRTQTEPAKALASPPSDVIAAPTENAEPQQSARPSIDWRAEGSAAAARQAAPPASTEFAPPPQAIHKPCKNEKSSWEWNEQPKKAGFARIPYGVPLPYVVLGRCVIGLGFFGCSPQKPPEANSHLLDDMRDGKTSPSSVPDPDRCD